VRCHDTNNAASACIQTSSNNTENNIFTGENTSNSRVISNPGRAFHNTNSRRPVFTHKPRDLTNCRLGPNRGWLGSRVHNRCEVWQCRLFTERIDIGKHSSRLRVSCANAKFTLNTSQGAVEFLRRGRAALNLVKGLMENFCDIEQTNYIAFFITNRLYSCISDVMQVIKT
jgi:hypothetical protein